MPLRCPRRNAGLAIASCIAVMIIAGCDKGQTVGRAPSSSVISESASTPVIAEMTSSGWNPTMGRALLVQGETRDEAIVLLPSDSARTDSMGLAELMPPGLEVMLFGRGGTQFVARLGAQPVSDNAECRILPVSAIRGDGAASLWAVGFAGGQISSLPLDSVDVLSSRDSMTLVAEASRLASSVTASTTSSFQGLRFTAHDIRRFEAARGVQAIVAHLVRKVNQEANPQEEQTLLIAERDSDVTSGVYQLVYAERTHGLEEEVAAPEVIAGIRVAGRATLIVARDSDAGVSYAVLERYAPKRWRVRWTSAPTRCG